MNIKTQAIKISKDTWPIAVACLGGSFAALPFNQVDGGYLVINSFVSAPGYRQSFYGPRGNNLGLAMGNEWLTKEDFDFQFEWDGRSRNHSQFFDVVRSELPKPRQMRLRTGDFDGETVIEVEE